MVTKKKLSSIGLLGGICLMISGIIWLVEQIWYCVVELENVGILELVNILWSILIIVMAIAIFSMEGKAIIAVVSGMETIIFGSVICYGISIDIFEEWIIAQSLGMLTYSLIVLLVLGTREDKVTKGYKIIRGLWFVPALAYMLRYIFHNIGYYNNIIFSKDTILNGIFCIGLVCVGRCVTREECWYKIISIDNVKRDADVFERPYGYINLVVHILLFIFTFGVWQCIWIFKTTRVLNIEKVKQRGALSQLLLCMFIPFYLVFWTYRSAYRIDLWARQRGQWSDLSVACLLLAIFIPFIPPIWMQAKINILLTQKK